jgi:hypothetical protein
VDPVGWAARLPLELVLSYSFDRAVGLVVLVSGLLWLFKRALPWSPLICAGSYGLLISLKLSRMYYAHRLLQAPALLLIFAAFYGFRHREIADSLRRHRFWTTPVYPRWVVALTVAYFGLSYSYAGLLKIWTGGLNAGSGLALQLYVTAYNGGPEKVPLLGQMLVRSRPLATAMMTATVIFEAGAMFAFLSRRVRPWWALALLGFQVGVLVVMHISFEVSIFALAWIAAAGQAWIPEYLGRLLPRRPALNVTYAGGLFRRAAVDLIYALDLFGFVQVQEPTAEGMGRG